MITLAADAAVRGLAFLLLSAITFAPIEWVTSGDRAGWWRRWRRHAPLAAALLCANVIVADALATGLAAHAPVLLDPRATIDVRRLAAFLLATELASYALHRAMHASPLLWRFHRLHHDPPHLCWWDAWRQHPVDALLHVAAALGLAFALSVPLVALAPLFVARKLYTSLLHADVAVRGSWLDRIVGTPAFHQRHHAAGPPGNYAAALPLIDLLFGTWRSTIVARFVVRNSCSLMRQRTTRRARRGPSRDQPVTRRTPDDRYPGGERWRDE